MQEPADNDAAQPRDSRQTVSRLRQTAAELGFCHLGIAPAVEPAGFAHLQQWLQQAYDADMTWISRRQDAYRSPQGVMPTTRTVIMAAMNYYDGRPAPQGPRVARYAQGSSDYHDVLRSRLRRLADVLHNCFAEAKTRIVVDTAPLLERDFARMAGIGWFGKNTMLISRQSGSWFFLGAILTDLVLPPDQPFETNHCGTCTRCLDACPTNAFPEPGVLDARRCISYLTIERRGLPIPAELRSGIGDWVFGCDVCQEVCPWNRFAPEDTLSELASTDQRNSVDCLELLRLTDTDFGLRFRKTPFERPGRSGLLRNAAIVLGNRRELQAEPDLINLLADDDAVLRGAAAWALGQLQTTSARHALLQRLQEEPDPAVCDEIRISLEQ
ncbi:MAG: tRNA epoxyqueuosine(34) reductase QueG [Planctomycetaceae bacterium]|nr:tRNA epoxyqueuosine(34) reductase QueG [Planctomycetaceae bacterium]